MAYQGDPETGKTTLGFTHEHHIWCVDEVKAQVHDQREAVSYFCGGSRNFSKFIHLSDGVFVLEVDLETLNQRLRERPANERGGKEIERELIVRLHQTKEDTPKSGIIIDATAPLAHFVDEIVRQSNASRRPGTGEMQIRIIETTHCTNRLRGGVNGSNGMGDTRAVG